MRPVNLIPADERRGEAAPARAGAASYIVVAVLIAVLFAVTGVVLTNNSVKQKESALAAAETQQAETQARASALANFADFQLMKDARVDTVAQLAESRFDWQRVIRELSLVLPDTVWLTNVTGSVAPEVVVPKAAKIGLRAGVDGPALSLVGCARSQQDVAELISSIGDIDGVSRVLVEKSEKPTNEVSSSSKDNINEDCRTRSFISKFELVAAFDEVVAGPAAAPPAAAAAATAATPAAAPAAADAGATTTAAAADQTAAPEEAQAQSNVAAGTAKAKKAAGLIGAGGGG